MELADVPLGRKKKNLKRENSPGTHSQMNSGLPSGCVRTSRQHPSTTIHGQLSLPVCSVSPLGVPRGLLATATQGSCFQAQPRESNRQPSPTAASGAGGGGGLPKAKAPQHHHGPSESPVPALTPPGAPERQPVSPGLLFLYSPSALPAPLAASLCPHLAFVFCSLAVAAAV